MHPFGQIKSIFNLIDHEAIVVNDEPLSWFEWVHFVAILVIC
jgi:hypothetical protein